MVLELNTTYGNGKWNERFHQIVQCQQDTGVENQVVNLYPEMEYDTLEGFGGAITDSAGYVYSLMNEEQKRELMTTYFAEDRMRYGMVRIHMDSCDFSTEMYEAMSDESDIELDTFSFARTEKYILPMLEDAQRAAGKPLSLMLSPWSPPAFMKTNHQRTQGGSLKPEYRGMWAEYLCRYILEFVQRGYQVQRISIQNEPQAVQTWDSCIYTAQEEKEFLRDYLAPALKRHGLQDIEVFIWDHNKERVYERMKETLDEETEKLVTGAAFHWYSGDHFEGLELAKRRFPDQKLILSESCIEFYKFEGDSAKRSAEILAHEMIGDLNHGMTAFYDWNMLLDETGGPNHVKNYALAPFMFDTTSKTLMPQLIQQYYEHFSHYLVPGSVRIGFSKYTEELDVTAYKRPDGSIAVVILNKSEEPAQVCLRMERMQAEFLLYGKSITTGVLS